MEKRGLALPKLGVSLRGLALGMVLVSQVTAWLVAASVVAPAEARGEARTATVDRIAFVQRSSTGPGDTYAIRTMAPDGSDVRTVVGEGPRKVAGVAWFPDGTRLVYALGPDPVSGGPYEIRIVDADGTDDAVVLACAIDPCTQPDPSPDGSKIIFMRGQSIQLMDADGSHEATVLACSGTCTRQNDPAWSPDGARIAFSRDHAVAIADADGGNEWEPLGRMHGTCRSPQWSPDGAKLAFYCGRKFLGIHWDKTASRSFSWAPLTDCDPVCAGPLSWSPDGRTLVVGTLDGLFRLARGCAVWPGSRCHARLLEAGGSQPDWV